MPRLIASRQSHKVSVETVMFSPDGKQLVSRSWFGDVKLWDGRNLDPIATSKDLTFQDSRFKVVALSNCLLATATDNRVSLWDPELIDTIEHRNSKVLSFSNDGGFLASFHGDRMTIFDIVQLSAITTLKHFSRWAHEATFRQDNVQFVVHFDNGDFQSFGVSSNQFWEHREHYCLIRSSSQYEYPVPVHWIPKSLGAVSSVMRSSMIAVGCNDDRVVFVKSSSSVG